MIGINSTNALIGLIYEKQLRMSSATNKQFTTGEIINFVQTDAQKLFFLSGYLPQVATIPFLLIFTLVVLFTKLSWTFFGGAAVLAIGFYTNYRLSIASAKLQKVYMKAQDARMSLTTECLNNIKIIKIYGWTDVFLSMISDKRRVELAIMIKKNKLGVANVSALYLFP